jgi:thioredoxin reductase (NADPH)
MLELPGGQITALYPEKKIFDVAGFPEVLGRDLVERLVAQVEPFAPVWLLGIRIEGLVRNGERWIVKLSNGTEVTTTVVVITGGIGTFEPRPLPVGRDYEGRGLIYYVPKPSVLENKRVVIVGGGDSAFDWALALEPIATSVSLVHRRDAFRAHEHTIELVRNSSADIITNAEVTAIFGEENLTSVEITIKTGDVKVVEADIVVAALGFVAHLGPLAEWGLEMSKRTIVVDTAMRTNLPGVFAAGDITEYPGKVRLISVGFGEAALAVNNAMTVIDPSKSAFPGHSSEAS